jgi:hypothetical protein
MDAERARTHFRAAIAAARPQERMQLRRMAEASLALAERRVDDLKVASAKLGQPAPSGRQLLALRFMGLIAPPKSRGALARVRGILIFIALVVGVLALGWGLVMLVALPFGGIDWTLAIFWGFLLVVIVLGVLIVVGRRRQGRARARMAEQRGRRCATPPAPRQRSAAATGSAASSRVTSGSASGAGSPPAVVCSKSRQISRDSSSWRARRSSHQRSWHIPHLPPDVRAPDMLLHPRRASRRSACHWCTRVRSSGYAAAMRELWRTARYWLPLVAAADGRLRPPAGRRHGDVGARRRHRQPLDLPAVGPSQGRVLVTPPRRDLRSSSAWAAAPEASACGSPRASPPRRTRARAGWTQHGARLPRAMRSSERACGSARPAATRRRRPASGGSSDIRSTKTP